MISPLCEEISKIEEEVKEEKQLSGETLNKLWLFTKAFSLSDAQNSYEFLLNKVEQELTKYRNKM